MYRSVTRWQSGSYDLIVQTGVFFHRQEALAFGRQPMRLKRLKRDSTAHRLVLVDRRTGVELAEASDSEVQVLKLKESAQAHRFVLTDADFERQAIPISQFESIADLSGSFASLSFGAIEVSEIHFDLLP